MIKILTIFYKWLRVLLFFAVVNWCGTSAAQAEVICGVTYSCVPYQSVNWRYIAYFSPYFADSNFYPSADAAYAALQALADSRLANCPHTLAPLSPFTLAFSINRVSAYATAVLTIAPTSIQGCNGGGETVTGYIDGFSEIICPQDTSFYVQPNGTGGTCIGFISRTCPVTPLTPIADPVALQHENGQYEENPDLDHVTPATNTGAACIKQRVAGMNTTARITSGYRPAAYQTHLREVWDKWQLLKNDTTTACQVIKADVRTHWVRHGMVRQPGHTSNHSSGTAVDIGGVPEGSADTIATHCNMYRPYADDRVHYQPR